MENIPSDLLKVIFSFLSKQQLLWRASLVCKKWKTLIYETASFWKVLVIEDIPPNSPLRLERRGLNIFLTTYFQNHLEEFLFHPQMGTVFDQNANLDEIILNESFIRNLVNAAGPRLRKLRVRIVDNELNTSLIVHIFQRCPNLIDISLRTFRSKRLTYSIFSSANDYLEQLEVFDIPFNTFPDSKNLHVIRSFFKKFGPSLQYLNFETTYFSTLHYSQMVLDHSIKLEKFIYAQEDDDGGYLENILIKLESSLKWLDIWRKPPKNVTSLPYHRCKNLQMIGIFTDYNATIEWMNTLAKFVTPKYLMVKVLPKRDDLLVVASKWGDSLERLAALSGDIIYPPDIIKNFPNLRAIRLYHSYTSIFDPLLKMTKLESLFLNFRHPLIASPATLAYLKPFLEKRGSHLRELYLGPEVSDEIAQLIEIYCLQLGRISSCLWRKKSLYQ
jgi:hypothetical protein